MAIKLDLVLITIFLSMCGRLSAKPNCIKYGAIKSFTKVQRNMGSAWQVIQPSMTLQTTSLLGTEFSLCIVGTNPNRRNIRWTSKAGTTYGMAASGSQAVFKPLPVNNEIVFQVSWAFQHYNAPKNCQTGYTLQNSQTSHYLKDDKGTINLAQTVARDRLVWWCLY